LTLADRLHDQFAKHSLSSTTAWIRGGRGWLRLLFALKIPERQRSTSGGARGSSNKNRYLVDE